MNGQIATLMSTSFKPCIYKASYKINDYCIVSKIEKGGGRTNGLWVIHHCGRWCVGFARRAIFAIPSSCLRLKLLVPTARASQGGLKYIRSIIERFSLNWRVGAILSVTLR